MPLAGELSTYSVGSYRYPYFTSGDLTSTKCIAFIGGLTAGLGSVPYMPALSEALSEAKWKLVQFHWASAYDGYETGSLDRDVRDMRALAEHLANKGMTDLVWMGNSTGCQDIAHFLSTSSPLHPIVKGGILQAPVSDRESLEHNDETKAMSTNEAEVLLREAAKARGMIDQGKGDEVAEGVRKILGGSMTWDRLHSLYARGGEDDYFSSDLPSSPDDNPSEHLHPLSTSFGRFTVPTLALWSEKDQYAWNGNGGPEAWMKRWRDACKPETPLTYAVIQGADHQVFDKEAQGRMMEVVLRWLRDIGLMES